MVPPLVKWDLFTTDREYIHGSQLRTELGQTNPGLKGFLE